MRPQANFAQRALKAIWGENLKVNGKWTPLWRAAVADHGYDFSVAGEWRRFLDDIINRQSTVRPAMSPATSTAAAAPRVTPAGRMSAPSGAVSETEGRIDRIWVWTGGRAPSINLDRWVQNRVDLGITDIVISLNDYNFTGGLRLYTRYYRNGSWGGLREIFEAFRAQTVEPHVMVFLRPKPLEIAEAASRLQALIRECGLPRSIHLDLEAWWTRRAEDERRAGEAAIRSHFFSDWVGNRPALGVGVTCIASIPSGVQGVLRLVDFGIPQMYASEGNYGINLSTTGLQRAQRHYTRAVEALGAGKRVYIGQTANPSFVTPRRMRDMLDVVLQLGPVHEVAFWSDLFLDEPGSRRAFVQRICSLAKAGGLTRATLRTVLS